MAEAVPPAPASDLDLVLGCTGTVEGDDGDQRWTLSAAPLGTLVLQTGEVVVGDPFTGALSGPPLARRFAPGPHSATLCVARLSPAHLRVAGLVLQRPGRSVARWAPATDPDGTPVGLPVDAGTLAIACSARAAALDTEAHSAARLAAFADDDLLGCRHPEAPDALVAATSGWGDGIYAAWWGLDAAGEPAALVLDTEVLQRPLWSTATLPLPLPRFWTGARLPLLAAAGIQLSRPFFSSTTVTGTALRRIPRLRVGPPGGPWRTVPPATVRGETRWALGPVAPGDHLELGLVTGHRPARRLDG